MIDVSIGAKIETVKTPESRFATMLIKNGRRGEKRRPFYFVDYNSAAAGIESIAPCRVTASAAAWHP